MAYIQANGINIYYELKGKGTPLVFISGFSTHHETWRTLADRFSNNYQTLIFDNRGAGQTDAPPPPYSIELMARDTAALMEALGIEKASFIGASMGTAIIQTLALLFPEKIEKGVLITPFAKLPQTSVMKSEVVGKLLQADIPRPLIIDCVIPWLYSNQFLSQPEKVQAKKTDMVGDLYPQKPEGYLGQLAALQTFDLQEALSHIHASILLIAGEDDLFTPPYCAEFMHENFPTSELEMYSDVGHMVHIEKNEAVANRIETFFQ